jgi:hypothetical protein
MLRSRLDRLERNVTSTRSPTDPTRQLVDEACRQWVISGKAGPMYWLRNWTATENFQWKEQGLQPLAPFPHRPYLDRQIDLSLLPFEVGEDVKSGGHRLDYLDIVMGYLLVTKSLFIPKTREMMTSWVVVGFITWFCQFYEKIEWLSQSEMDEKAMGLIKYANILYRNQPDWMRAIHPLKRNSAEGTLHAIEWANGSLYRALAQGQRKVASSHPHGYFNDETAHQAVAGATVDIARPAVKQVVCVSSVAPGWFATECGEEAVAQ